MHDLGIWGEVGSSEGGSEWSSTKARTCFFMIPEFYSRNIPEHLVCTEHPITQIQVLKPLYQQI